MEPPQHTLSIQLTRQFVRNITNDLHDQECAARIGRWDVARWQRITENGSRLKERCDVKDEQGQPVGYTDDMDPFASEVVTALRQACMDVYALSEGCHTRI